MRWIVPLQVVTYAAMLVALIGFTEVEAPLAASVFGGICLLAFWGLAELKCPRCGFHLTRRDTRPFVVPSLKPLPTECPNCQRSRFGVYPLQRKFRPEDV